MLRQRVLVGPVTLALLGGFILGGCGSSGENATTAPASQTRHHAAMAGAHSTPPSRPAMQGEHRAMRGAHATRPAGHAMKGAHAGHAMGSDHMGG